MEWKEWSSVTFEQLQMLPPQPGIYVVVDAAEEVWYVGRAININSRWRGHHRYQQIKRTEKKRSHRIYWKNFNLGELCQKEELYINAFKPHLNYTPVKKYPQKSIQPHEEISRIFKAINQKTSLFPDKRSLVLGFYQEMDETETGELQEYTCIVVAVSVNDHDGIIMKSAVKSTTRKGINIKANWRIYSSECGCSEENVRAASIPVFMLENTVYEFVPHPTLVDVLGQDSCQTHTLELARQSVLALKDPMAVDRILTRKNLASKTYLLSSEDYLKYRVSDLKAASLLFPEVLADKDSLNTPLQQSVHQFQYPHYFAR